MNFKDQWAEDENGERFVFTVEMQRRLSEAGLPVEPASLADLDDEEVPAYEEQREERSSYGQSRERSQDRSDDRPREPRRERSSRPSREEEVDDMQPPSIQIEAESGKYIGRLKWYDRSKGYGFIARGGGQDIFFHRSAVVLDPDGLKEGQWVLYDVEDGRKGPEATDVEPYEGEEPVY